NGSVKQPMRGAQGSAPPPPFLLALPVPVLLLLELPVPDDPCFNSRVPRAGAIRLKYSLCIVLLFILSSFLISLPYQKARYLSPRHHGLCRRWNKNPLSYERVWASYSFGALTDTTDSGRGY